VTVKEYEKERVFILFKQLVGELEGLFVFRGERYRCECMKGYEEGLVVDRLAYYDLRLKEIFVCEKNLLQALTTYKVGEGCERMFMLYVLLHEFVHYVLDFLGFGPVLVRLPNSVRFDEPFSEYIALRSCIEGRLRIFGYVKEIHVKEDEKRCVSLFSTMYRPAPYRYFKPLYASQENLLNISAELIFLKLVRIFSRIPAVNPDPIALSRLLFVGPTSELDLKEEKRYKKVLHKIPVVAVSWCSYY
jgi:hypothetical protein